ncbi:unnamed protein product [Rotaria sordida]|uniref:EGF-like domain-containing protein n=1 Tax=Rotaria sordida TaxID=392033 RepID=A0A818UI70_9BILA|nr:unnamed protein product [Rotaria sordida]CAF3697475.1 unnamed protein product [Rotaria sordida]
MRSFLYGYILILSISLTIAVQLDGNCQDDTQCEGPNIHCLGGKCQCNSPAYVPCKSRCEINNRSAYEGEHCEVNENCIENTICSEKRCKCIQDYTAKNGLCFKNLNSVCASHTECWSQHCSNSRCVCAPGYENPDNQAYCKRKLVKIYNNWSDANREQALCVDDNSCIDIVAKCIAGPQNVTTKFCKCPFGYKVDDKHEQCERILGTLLSPLDSPVSNYGECGSCQDINAACIQAADQITCWCRFGYIKKNNACEKESNRKPLVIFPNSNDLNLHDFTNNCTSGSNNEHETNNKLCVCAPGYEFITKDQSCVKIQRDWINDIYEYGLCTRITPQDKAIDVDGLCPKPLICEARKDKHICSCGKDKFRDLNDPSQCVYYIGKTTNSTDDKCPTKKALRNITSGICECSAGYNAINNNRQCGIKLSSEIFQSSCNSNQLDNKICRDLFGKNALFCTIGECRCSGNQSFSNKDQTHCYAPLNQSLIQPMEDCPLQSSLKDDHCECNVGYRPSNDFRQCVRLTVQLVAYVGPSINTNGQLTTEDCQALFTGPVESYTNDRCQCKNIAFINDNNTGCWYQLNVTLPEAKESVFCPPNSATGSGRICLCSIGYTRNVNKCVPITNRVYIDNDPMAPNIAGLTESACRKWFGYGATQSSRGSYCICKPYAYLVKSNSYCHFLLNQTTSEFKTSDDCPANTFISPSSPPSACVCKPGYRVSSDNRTCTTTNIVLSGTVNVSSSQTTNCVSFTNDDCIVKYGEHAFCQNEACFCNRRVSFINAIGQCESFSKYIFPGIHERQFYSCNTETDCQGKGNVICDYLNDGSPYKVCKCKDESLLDPKSQTCIEKRCTQNCQTNLNFECRGYDCVCRNGFYQTGLRCIKIPYELQLNQPCNRSGLWEYVLATANNSLECDASCDRARCQLGYRPEQSQCVPYQFGEEKCIYQENICQYMDENSICNIDKNKCLCRPSYYLFDNRCVPAVGTACRTNEECGFNICKGQRCDCKDGQRIETTYDIDGRPIKHCTNGIDQIRFSPVLLLFFIMIHKFFI